MAILLCFGKVVFEILVNIFPFNIFELLGRVRKEGDNLLGEQEGDGGVAKVACPVATVVVAHDRVCRRVEGDGVELPTTGAIDFGTIALEFDTLVGDSPQGFVDFDNRWLFPDRHICILSLDVIFGYC